MNTKHLEWIKGRRFGAHLPLQNPHLSRKYRVNIGVCANIREIAETTVIAIDGAEFAGLGQ